MRRFLLSAFFYMLACNVQSQVLLSPQLPAAGLTLKSQLWNFSLVNTSAGPVDVIIEITFSRVGNNQLLFSAVSRRFTIARGLRQVRVLDVMPIAYTIGPGSGVDQSPDGFLPVGIFSICYTVIVINNDAYDRLAESCEMVEVEPASPPQLISPYDGEYVDYPRPLFLWLPPSPAQLFSNLRYDWSLVEVQSIQSPGDALQQNIPVLSQQNISWSNLQYPLSAPALDSSKLYAWRIHAKDNSTIVSSSEIWTFRLKQFVNDSFIVMDNKTYYKLRKEESSSYSICTGMLRFEFLNEENASVVKYTLTDLGTSRRKSVQVIPDTGQVHFGQNFIELDLTQTRGLKKSMYLLQVTNVKNQKWFLKFEYRRPD